MHTKLSEDAVGDLEALKSYVEPRSPRGYVVLMASIFTTMEQLETFRFSVASETSREHAK